MALFGPELFTVHRAWGSSTSIAPASPKGHPSCSTFCPVSSAPTSSLGRCPSLTFLKGILRSPAFADDRDFPNSILAVARAHATTLIALRGRSGSGSRRPVVPAATKLIRRTERLVRERRTGTAMQSAEKLQDHIDRDLILKGTVTTIFPGNCSVNSRVSLPAHLSSCHSLLRPTLLDRSVHSPHRLRRGRDAVLKKLSIGAAAGASGWTYAVMKAIFLCNGDYSDRASQPLSAT